MRNELPGWVGDGAKMLDGLMGKYMHFSGLKGILTGHHVAEFPQALQNEIVCMSDPLFDLR